jgi:hypothetical protein
MSTLPCVRWLWRLQVLVAGISQASNVLLTFSVPRLLDELLPLLRHFGQKRFEARISCCAGFLKASRRKSLVLSCVLHRSRLRPEPTRGCLIAKVTFVRFTADRLPSTWCAGSRQAFVTESRPRLR